MTEYEFKSAIYNYYVDDSSQITERSNAGPSSTGNGQLHNGLYLAVLKYKGWAIDERDMNLYRNCMALSYKEPGVYYRNKYKHNADDDQSRDNYIGIMAMTHWLDREMCRYIYNENSKRDWEILGKNVARGVGDEDFFESCATGNVSGCMAIKHKAILLTDGMSANDRSDGHILMFIRGLIMGDLSNACKGYFHTWQATLASRFGSLGASWRHYLPESHPIIMMMAS